MLTLILLFMFQDIRVVSDKYKSGFIPPSDIAFEDLGANGNAMEAASPTGSVQSLNPTEAAKPKPVKKKVFGIFGGSKVCWITVVQKHFGRLFCQNTSIEMVQKNFGFLFVKIRLSIGQRVL